MVERKITHSYKAFLKASAFAFAFAIAFAILVQIGVAFTVALIATMGLALYFALREVGTVGSPKRTGERSPEFIFFSNNAGTSQMVAQAAVFLILVSSPVHAQPTYTFSSQISEMSPVSHTCSFESDVKIESVHAA